MIEFATNKYSAPIALRYPRGSAPSSLNNSDTPIELGKGVITMQGNDLTIIASGKMVYTAMEVRELLKAKNIDA